MAYNKSDFKQVSWEEYEKTLKVLLDKIHVYLQENSLKIDAVVPIMRGGATPGAYLAYKLNILAILPVQYKYFFEQGEAKLKKLTELPEHYFNLPENPTFLIVESNHCFGNTASTATKDLKTQFPGCNIIYAVDHIDASFKDAVKEAKVTFYGKLTDECRLLTLEKAKELNIELGVSYLLPWESIDEEWATVQGKQFSYDGSEAEGEIKMSIPLQEGKLPGK